MITYDQIKAASDGILTTNIKGKEYAAVNGRINAFRRLFPQGLRILRERAGGRAGHRHGLRARRIQ